MNWSSKRVVAEAPQWSARQRRSASLNQFRSPPCYSVFSLIADGGSDHHTHYWWCWLVCWPNLASSALFSANWSAEPASAKLVEVCGSETCRWFWCLIDFDLWIWFDSRFWVQLLTASELTCVRSRGARLRAVASHLAKRRWSWRGLAVSSCRWVFVKGSLLSHRPRPVPHTGPQGL